MNLKNVTQEQMSSILKKSKSLREVIIKFGLSPNGSGGYRNIKKKIISLDLEIPIYDYYGNHQKNNKKNNSEVFIENSTYPRQSLKKRVIEENLINYSCEICGNNGIFQGKPLSLQLDHKNGISNDNRIENLRFLCPNCHSQTPTYGGKSRKKSHLCQCGNKMYKSSVKCRKCLSIGQRKVERPSIEQIKEDIKILGYKGTGRKYGVSDNSIRKWLK